MCMLSDGNYDVFIVDARDIDDARDALQLELTITSGEHKGEVVTVRAANLRRNAIDLIGMPASLRVAGGVPSVEFD